jgi:dipeptidyl aminopeptidase/acylaminoacyl peptidase
VLSIERPANVSSLSPMADGSERIKLDYQDWADRRSVMSAFRTGIEILDARGVADRRRIGITGLSDGTSSAQFALLNSDLFAAASLSACCEDPKTLMALLGPTGAATLQRYRYPRYTSRSEAFWSPYSIAENAGRFKTPLLLQSADDEYLMTLETFTALREAQRPVELIVFPGEHHMKWQPAHRLALYRRNIAWFMFWLTGDAPGDVAPSELSRWQEMRARMMQSRIGAANEAATATPAAASTMSMAPQSRADARRQK